MTLAPILQAPLVIQLHLAAVVFALLLAPIQLALPKGTQRHRLMGRIWVAAMVTACLSALLILDQPIPPSVGPFSWLHLFAIFTLVMLWRAVAAVRRSDVVSHRKGMIYLAAFGLGVPLLFAVMVPGRVVYRALFGG